MPEYFISVPTTATMFMIVDAESEEQALEIAEQELYSGLCNHCSNRVEMDDDPDWDKVEVTEQ